MFNTYVIIGGKSSRMGTDKASLLFEGQTFLNRIIKAVNPQITSIKLVSSLEKHQNLSYETIPDIETNKGPVSAIASALSHTNTPLNLILSCDIPLIQQNLLDWLLKQHNDIFQATLICCNGKKMPLIGIYNKNCLPTFKEHLNINQLKLMTVLEDLKVNFLEVPEIWKQQILNINTPEQLKAIQ